MKKQKTNSANSFRPTLLTGDIVIKFLTQKCLIANALLLSAVSLQAETVKFSAPAEYCFPQTSVRSKSDKFDQVILDHNLIVNEEDHFKTGDIFVGFRRKSQPGVLWLNNGFSWINTADITDAPRSRPVMLPNGDGTLQPIMPITVSNEPIDVSAYIGDGEVWVGYGLRAVGETWKESYENMINNNRFSRIWEIIPPSPFFGLPDNSPTICLIATEMKKIIGMAGIPLPPKENTTLDIEAIEVVGTTAKQ